MGRELVAHADEGTRRSELYEHSYYLVFETTDSSVVISAFARSLPIWKPMVRSIAIAQIIESTKRLSLFFSR